MDGVLLSVRETAFTQTGRRGLISLLSRSLSESLHIWCHGFMLCSNAPPNSLLAGRKRASQMMTTTVTIDVHFVRLRTLWGLVLCHWFQTGTCWSVINQQIEFEDDVNLWGVFLNFGEWGIAFLVSLLSDQEYFCPLVFYAFLHSSGKLLGLFVTAYLSWLTICPWY